MASGPVLPNEDGQVSLGIDDLHISLHAEQEDTQKKAFTCWINSKLAKHTPPSVVSDLFTDIKQGHILLDLLEVLSGQQLPRDKGTNTFQCRINIEHALTFLQKRSIKLINIHVTDIVDGNPSIILGLIWTIILHFHIEKLAQTLSCSYNPPSLDSVSVVDSSPTSSPPAKKCSKTRARWQMSAKKALLSWAQEQCATDESVIVTDFKTSWRNGMAFLAIIHALRPDLIDMKSVKHRSNKDNLNEAFRIAERELKIPKLLEPEDVDVVNPDEKSIMTYIAQFLQYSKDKLGTGDKAQGKMKEAMAWVAQQETKLQNVLKDSENKTYSEKYESLLSYLESFNEEKKPFLDILPLKDNLDELNEDQLQLSVTWNGLNSKIHLWKTELNDALPSPLHQIEAWLQETEKFIDEDLPASQDYFAAMTLLQEKMTLFKVLMDKSDYYLNILLAFENRDEKHLPLVPANKLEEMKRRINNISGKKFITLLEFHYYKYTVLGLLKEVKSKLDIWNIKYGTKESVELLLVDWQKFIEEKEFLAQLESSFKKCEESYKNLAAECQDTSEQYEMVERDFCMYRTNIDNVKSTLQNVLKCWATYVENLRLLKACFEETKKEHIKEVPYETLSQWNLAHGTLNEAGNFLIRVSSDEVGTSISKELRRLNKRWRKFIPKAHLEMKLPLLKTQDQPVLDNSGSIHLSEEEKRTVDFSTDMPVECPENHNQNIKSGEEQEKECEEFTGQLKVAEDFEKLIGQVQVWEAEATSVLDLLQHKDDISPSVEESLQHLIAKGSMFEELVSRTEDILQMDVQNISSHESLQHILTAGLQTKIQEVKEKVQINMTKLVTALKNSTEVSPDLDVRWKVENSQKELESSISKAELLLSQRESKSELISKYKEAITIFNTRSLTKYLKAVEELKSNATEVVKLSLEEKSKEICTRWERLHHEMSLYIQQLKIDIEKGKLSDNISKLEKQINKEKKLIRRGRTKGLIKEHEACFSEEGYLYHLDHHMQVLRELCKELTSQKTQQEVRRALKDYEQKIERLRKSASEIQMLLQPMVGGTSKHKGTTSTSENGGRDIHSEESSTKSDYQMPNEKPMESKMYGQESELQPQQEENKEKYEVDHIASKNNLLDRYDMHKETLTLHLKNNKSRITSDFPSNKERSSACLQDKLTDLQILKNETEACWKEFEITSLKSEELVSDTHKSLVVKTRDQLKRKERMLQKTLDTRMTSLETALQIVLPVEKESLLLCESDLVPHEVIIQDFHLTNADDVYQNLRNIQDSITKQIEICNSWAQSDNFVLKELDPLDLHATQDIIVKHRLQLEEMNHKMQMKEEGLKALEDFLSSLRIAKNSPVASYTQVVQENTLTVENKEGEIRLMKEKARDLDEQLKILGISLKDARLAEDASCEKLLDTLSKKLFETHSHGSQEELSEEKLLEMCIFKNNELLKNIQDVNNQLSKISLKDPTVPAIKQRKKSLIRLDKDLDDYEEESRHLQEMTNSLPQLKDAREEALNQQFQNTAILWENTKASVTECLDQCERVLELLGQYQVLKNILTTLIQKEENVISLQASYMGKEYLKKRIAEIEIVKEEFNEHLDVVDNINQICKNLQFHLNKMRTFEDPPFEKEANIIVDRWLDINEKTEDYCENLSRALALWEKLFNLKNVIDEWTENVLGTVHLHQLTEEEREKLKGDLEIHEQKSLEFSEKVAKIQLLLQSSEVPLELQVMKTSILKKIEAVKACLLGESISPALSGSTAELREDLDQAKTQIGMTESLLKALSPSDSLEIFTKLEEIQQQILQQKHSMILLENQIGCLTPELYELKKQYESVSDLFNTKKSVLQDHFSKLLNDQCKNFNDWFSAIKMNLKDCFESSETKNNMEEKLQKLSDFLTLEGKGSEIQQVATVLNHVKKHLPKAYVKELNSWIVSEEIELEKMASICQARAKELDDCVQQLLRLQDDHKNLSKWLTNQEEKWKEMEESGEKTDLFYQVLDRKREQFDSMAQVNNSLKEYGITEEEIIMESTHLISRYQTLLGQLPEVEDEDKLTAADDDQSFDDLTHDVIQWITEIKESLMVLNSSEGKMPLEERIQKIKEIILLKPEGDAKIETIMNQAEGSQAVLVPQNLADIKDQWDNTLHLANTYLSHQEKLLLEGEKYLQSKEDLRLVLTELKKKQEMGFALQHGLQEKEAQLKIYRKFLKKAQDLTSLLTELKSQGKYLLECTKNSSFSEESWLEIKHLHESLLQQLQDSVQKLEGHVKEHHSYQVCVTELNTALDNFSKEFLSLFDKPFDQIAAKEKLQKLQELENRLNLQDRTLEKMLLLAESINPNTSSAGQKIIKDEIKSLKDKQKGLENKLQSAEQELEKYLNSILKSKCSEEKKEKFTLPDSEKQVVFYVQESSQELTTVEKLEKDWDINKNSSVEMVLSKQLSPDVHESMKNTDDEQKVNELQNQPLELDVMLRNEQLKEIEELYMQLEAQKAAIERPGQTEFVSKTETNALVLNNARFSVHHLDSLLQTLMTIKKNKESQYRLLEDFQEHLAAVESSAKALLTEKESLKVGPLDSITYLEKIKKTLTLIEKEKCSLRKIKSEWENISNCLADMDKKFLESQIKNLEYSGEQLEKLVQKKYSQRVVEYNEFTFLMNKIQDLEVSLQQLHPYLHLRLNSPEEQAENQSLVAIVTELQTIHQRFSVLKRQAELQMKRIWGEKEKMVLEDAINNLQKQLEVLQPINREIENQIEKCEVRTKMKETIVWVKTLLGELIPPTSHPPDDILSQIRKCKMMHDDILKKQQAVESLFEEVKDNIPRLTAHENDDLNNLQHEYQMLVLKSTQRSQQLESKFEERRKYAAEIGEVQLLLQGNEALIIPPVETASTEAELEHQHVMLMASQQELQETESAISTYVQELTKLYKDLTVFERVFLDDQLKNLKTRVNRTQRFIQNKCIDVEHKINLYREFHEKASVLQKDVDNIQHNELLLKQEINQDMKEELCSFKDQLAGIQSSILQMLKLKELSDCIGLDMDYSQFHHLQSQIIEKESELEDKIKQLDTFVVEYDKYQASLRKLRTMNLQIKQRTEATLRTLNTSPESSLSNAHVLNQKIEKAMHLNHEIIKKLSENKAFDDLFKEKEILQIKQYEEENDRLHRVLQNAVLECQPKEVDEKNFQEKLENSLLVLNQMNSQLQKPVSINLKIEHIEDEKDNCEALQKQIQAEMHNLKALSVLGSQREANSSEARDMETKLCNIDDLHLQLNTGIDLHKSILNDASENMLHYEEAVNRAKGLITTLEAIFVSHRVDLEKPEESLEGPRWKHKELESTIADIQNLTEKLQAISSPEAKLQLQCTIQDLVSKNSAMREALEVKEAEVERCLENYTCYRKIKEKLYTDLSQMETDLGQSISPLPVSYKEALERVEQSKALVSNLMSTKEGLVKLRQVLRYLRPICTQHDGTCLLRIVSSLWDKWLSLLEAAREWEMWCEELKQEWKYVSEQVEREVIILDNLQEELPEISKPKEAATKEELSELQDSLCQFEENVEKQQLLFTLLLQRIKSIQHVPENTATIPAFQEITSMQERCHQLFQKAQESKEIMQNEIQERQSFTEEIINLKNLFQQITTSVLNLELQDHPERAEQFEKLQSILKKGKLTFENIMEKLRIKYSEMYTIVPAEIEGQVEECRKALEDVDEKISSEVLKSSPSYAMSRKIDEINNGLHNVEKMLQQKSKNIEKAQQVQKKMWDDLDLWHSRLNEMDSEVHDIVEQDPEQAQEWMDKLMVPFQRYQQVSQRAESRTSQLNKATVKMEEYHDLLKSTETWIENTGHLLDNPVDYDSSKMLSQHANTLQMALEDSEQKHNLLLSIFTDLEDLSIIFETDDLAQLIQELSHQVAALQQKIMESLPQIQQMADDVVAIENEVKSMEKRVSKIKAILLSKEIFDFSPEEHLKHGEVILGNICPMKKAIAEIMSYHVELRFPQTGMKSLPVFQRTNQLLHDIKVLENVTQKQNELLKIAIKQTNECDEEIENLQQVLNNYSTELSHEDRSPDQVSNIPHIQGEMEDMEKQILSLNQKKEDLLVDLKAALLNLHQHLQQEQPELGKEAPSEGVSEEDGVAERDVSTWQLNRTGSMSFLPAVEEEAEESSLKSENGDKKAEPSFISWSSLWKHDKDMEENGESSSSGTVIQEAAKKISTCSNNMAQSLAPDSLTTEQDQEFSLRPTQTEEGATPPTKAAVLGFSDEQGALEATVERPRLEPAEVLHVCKTQVAELEVWLQQANVVFEPETLNADMQQEVEQQLVGCQAMLTEIEHKVASLLENCKEQGLGDSGATQQEAEALSLKLKTVKCNLEKVQMMLQEKYSEDQNSAFLKKPSEHQKVLQLDNLPGFESVITERPQFSRQKDFQPQVLELKPVEQKDLIKFIEFKTQISSVSNKESKPEIDNPDLALATRGQSGDKWQYLHNELSSKITASPPQLVETQVATNMRTLPSVSVYNFRYPTTEELKIYTTLLEDLRQEANNLQTQENMTEETYLNLDKKLFELFLTLTQCLGSVEEMLQTPELFREDICAQQVHYETLALELKKLFFALSDRKDDLLKAMFWPGKTTTLFPGCVDNLQVYLEHTQATAASRSKSLKAGLDYKRSYQNEIKRLYDQLLKNKASLQQSLNEISSQNIDEQLQKADAHTMELQNSESRVAKLRDEGEMLHLPYVLLQDVYKLEDVLDSMWEILRAWYTELSSPFITQSQKDALLQGLVELVVTGKEKLAHDLLQQTKSKSALQTEIQNHKLFFQKLVADMLLIQTYSNKMLPSLLQKKETLWAEQVKEVKLLEERSLHCGIKLQSLLQKWEAFDENYASLEKDLEILVSTLPSVSLVEETEERLVERISVYQQIKRNIDEKRARLYQTLNEGKQLVISVSCPELEGQIAKLEEQWLSLNKRIDHELHRLQTLLKYLLSYNRDSDQLTKWLESSQQTLNYWKEQSLNVSQDLETIRSNINKFFEFTKELDDKSSLKTAVISTGNQLLHLKEADTATLRASLAQFEQKWAMFITQLPDIQEKLHQLQMEKLPSRKAITEMISWMNNVEHQTVHEDSEHSLSSASQVKNLLQKYKEFRMEMDYKQWIVDFVNQSLLQLSTCDVESKRYERTEFAEHLGEMNRQWQRIHGSLNTKIQHLEQLLESITENENKIQILNNWMEAQEERLKTMQKPESVISVQKMLLDCQDIENQLAIKSKALDELNQSYLTSESGRVPLLEDTASRIDVLLKQRNSVIHQVSDLKASTQSVLQEWKMYDKLYDEVTVITIRFQYCVEHSKPVLLSLEALRCQVQKLQSLQDEAENSEGKWEKLQEVIRKLKDYCPSVAEIIKEKCQDTHTRWTQINQDIADHLLKAQSLLQLWKTHNSAHTETVAKLEQQEAKYQQLENINMSGNNLEEILIPALQDIKELQLEVHKTKEAFLQHSTLLDRLPKPVEPSTPVSLCDQQQPIQRASYLEKMLLMKSNEFEFVLSEFQGLGNQLESLKSLIMLEEDNLNKLYEQQEKEEIPDLLLNHVLALAALSPDIEHLSEESLKVPLSDIAVKTLQNMKRQWIRATATALERFSELQGTRLNGKFLSCCEEWVQFLEKTEEILKANLAGSLPGLLEQQKTYEMLDAQVSINQTIADSYVTQSLQLLDTTAIDKRPQFVSDFTKLTDQWQSAAQGVRQRKSNIDELVRRWQYFTSSEKDLLHFLNNTSHLLSAVKSQDCYSHCQARSLIHKLKNKEVRFQRWQPTYALTVEAGEKLQNTTTTDMETKELLNTRIHHLQDNWKDTKLQVGEMIKQLQSTVETWDQCEKKIKELKTRLQVLKAQSKEPLPELHEDLHKEKELIKELEKALANWIQNLKELHTMKADLNQHIIVEDVMILKEQIEHLHRQWEDLCLRVAIRKQEIEDRLNSWIVFNEKNKELCAWLVQMENKVLQTADISIEEMIEKLQKDCMEEINLFSENKLQLKQMGDQLIKASNTTRAAEIDDKLNKINDRWQHLFDVIGSRVKKLKETFAFIQQLDKNMSNLRTWLAQIESELSKPVVYDVCDDQEIQKRLAEQQDLQRDIEQHSAGVESVFNICDVLLHDSDACANETECDSIQQTTRSLDRRWRNICAMSMERRMKIEETWRLWQKFLDDYSRFEDWLKSAERTAAYPNSSEVLYTSAKEELKRFEAFQRQIHERLTQLELINKQYRRLARENRTDTASRLKQMVHEGNQRWDNLQRRVTAILRRLRHFTNQRDEFEGTRESILVWLTEMDLQLTNVEHFSESDADDKMRQLNGFQQEITLNTNKIDQLIVFGEQLIQKSEPLDAVLIEDELEELHRYCQEVFGRVSRFHRRLTSHAPGLEDEKEASENEADMEDPREIQTDTWRKRRESEPSSPQSLCHLVPPAPGPERSGCETPVSVDSIPLEWDHTGDVGGSSSHEDDEEAPFYSALSDVEIPENPEAYLKMTTNTLKASSGKSISEGHSWHVPDSPSSPKHRYKQMGGERNIQPIPPEDSSTPYKPGYVKLLLSPGTDGGKEDPSVLKGDSQQGNEDLASLAGQQPGAFERWELIQAQELHDKFRLKQNLQQLNSDISDITTWLKKTEAELETFKVEKPPSDVQEMQLRVKRMQEILKAFEAYKALMVSVSVNSREFLQAESAESKELQSRVGQLSLHWDSARCAVESWRESLRRSLMQCQDFHQLSQNLLLWLANAESRRQKAHVTEPNADPQFLLECRDELMQLEKELVECQPQVNSLQEISNILLIKGHGEDYIEAEEKVHVIEKKLKQLLEQVSQDLMSLQESQFGAEKTMKGKNQTGSSRAPGPSGSSSSRPPRSFLSRVIRAALPLQLLLLLLLFLACLLPSSEEDYSCTQANNFARSFYPMLRYTNGPPPT